ncbi:serine hydrolase [Actinoplanes sp. Pm04-4]|uniref:Serine hydrolase n=1 Tax=Paractinoplanes pyxinae TaxID=2997416 RepID=A0ABT4BGH8_9ACTN|nr:serine hydrolase domain-containing protein [Actinoplanes pyxinae]MCY1144673.1 serine hydrolase [Actinoplanes pyxinae]
MLRRNVLLSLLAAVLTVPVAGAPAAAARPDQDTLQPLLEAVHAAGMPGLFAQVRDGRTTLRLAAGVADLETGRPAQPWFRHRIGSLTKTFVATTLLQLVGEGRLSLDAPIARFLPDALPAELGRKVTVRMLLNHTSGLGDTPRCSWPASTRWRRPGSTSSRRAS